MMSSLTALTREWLRLVATATSSAGHEICPAVATITVTPNDDYETDACRQELDCLLTQSEYGSIDTVAGTIFPYFLWNPNASRQQLFERYFQILPRIRKHNRLGVYFERLISYPGDKNQRGFNQLEHIINTYRPGRRRSALQASIVDPLKDLSTDAPYLGFPCMNHVGFLPNTRTQTLTVVAYYPMQYLYRRAYGNYLGLIRLGTFMGHEMGFTCDKVVCMAGVAKIEENGRELKNLTAKYCNSVSE
jgi:hypothetical protein